MPVSRYRTLRHWLPHWLPLLLILIMLPMGSVLSAAEPAETPAAAPPVALEVDDTAIAKRLTDIYQQMDGLNTVNVISNAGVVRLEGTVAEGANQARAVSIAERLPGVVAVQDRLERAAALDAEVAPAFARLERDVRNLVRAGPLLGAAALVAVLLYLVGRWLSHRRRLWERLGSNGFMAEFLAASVRIVFLVAALVVFFQMLGATALMGAVLGGAGVLGIALGFAVRDTVDNYISSLMLSLRQPFAASDHVRIGEVGEGRVIRLTPRATILMTLDGNQLRIPNATVFKSVILNFSRNPERRFQFDLGVDPAADLETARALAETTLAALPFVLPEPKAFAILADMGESTAIVRAHGWINQLKTDFPRARSRALLATVKAFEDAGLALPDPGMRVILHEPQTAPTPPAPAPAQTETKPAQEAAKDAAVAADDDIVRLVQQERALDSEDLLDPTRRQD